MHLAVEGDDAADRRRHGLRLVRGDYRYTWAPDGAATSLRADSGQTAYPADAYRAALAGRDRVAAGPNHG